MHVPLSPRSRAYPIPCHKPALLVRALTTREENLGIHANDWLRAARSVWSTNRRFDRRLLRFVPSF
jgi:hypothetical protein